MSLTIEELIEIVQEKYDPDLLIEILEITSEELLDRFQDKVEDYYYRFEEVQDYEMDEVNL